MSGTTSICLQQQFHTITGELLVGGLLYSRQAGTLTPQNAFRTASLTAGSEFPNPVVLDASARVPLMFYADGLIRLILTDKNGVSQFDYDNVPIIGSSSGGGAVDTTDPSRLYSTGHMMLRYGTGTVTGYVRANGRTIGSSTSGATEFPDATAQALFQFLWNSDPNLIVSPSRGASAVADWTANKQIATPDFRGCAIAGLDGMGNTLGTRLAATFGVNRDVLGSYSGADNPTITAVHLPLHGHVVDIDVTIDGSCSVPIPPHQHGYEANETAGLYTADAFGQKLLQKVILSSGLTTGGGGGGTFVGTASVTGTVNGTTENNSGGGGQFSHVQPTRLITVYLRL